MFLTLAGCIRLFYGRDSQAEHETLRKVRNTSQILSVSTFLEETTHKQILMLKISLKFKQSKT
jgi:hypothetical protein